MYIACPIDNRAPEALFNRGVRRHTPPDNFLILGLQKWRFLDFEHRFQITSALNVVSISEVNYLLLVKNPLIERCILLGISLLIPFVNLNYPAVTFDLMASRWRQINHDARTIENEAEKASDSQIAGSYIQEARMIHPIYAPLKYCNLRYSMWCIFKLIFFGASSKTKNSSRGISKGGFRHIFTLEIIFIFITQKGGSRTPGTLPRLRPCYTLKFDRFSYSSKFYALVLIKTTDLSLIFVTHTF